MASVSGTPPPPPQQQDAASSAAAQASPSGMGQQAGDTSSPASKERGKQQSRCDRWKRHCKDTPTASGDSAASGEFKTVPGPPPRPDMETDPRFQHFQGRRHGRAHFWQHPDPRVNPGEATAEFVPDPKGFVPYRGGPEHFRGNPEAVPDSKGFAPFHGGYPNRRFGGYSESGPDPKGFGPYPGGPGHFGGNSESGPDPKGFVPYQGGYPFGPYGGGYPPFHGHRYRFYGGRCFQGGPESTYIFREFDFM